jgi:mannose-6-phosphate isomerase-like protein (cupin superfamily)
MAKRKTETIDIEASSGNAFADLGLPDAVERDAQVRRAVALQRVGSPAKIVVAEKLARFSSHFDPKIVGELNGQHVKLVKFQGEFVWHHHEHEDEMFFVISGEFDMQFRDRTVRIGKGEFIIVPRGVEHCPKAEREVAAMLFEPASTVNTGTAGGGKTVDAPEWI